VAHEVPQKVNSGPEARRTPAANRPQSPPATGLQRQMLELQRLVGNRATVSALGLSKEPAAAATPVAAVVQRRSELIQRDFLKDAKLGLELTFNNAFTGRLGNAGTDMTRKELTEGWDDIKDQWADKINGAGPGQEPVKPDDSQPNKSWGNVKDLDTRRFNYAPTASQGNQKRPLGELSEPWWFELSLDPGVLEIQTMPTAAREFTLLKEEEAAKPKKNRRKKDDEPVVESPGVEGAIHKIVEKQIFGIADDLDFAAGGGGGHINVDLETGFDGNHGMIPRVLAATEIVINRLRRDKEGAEGRLVEWDYENQDPFLSTPRLKMPLAGAETQTWKTHEDPSREERSVPETWKLGGRKPKVPESKEEDDEPQGRKTKKSANKVKEPKKKPVVNEWDKFKLEHAEWLHERPTLAQYNAVGTASEKFGGRLDEETVRKVLHYQAVNIEHVAEEEAATRRLEFRFFKGQESIQDIYSGAQLISEIVKEANRQ
jgi:hypothetical protein